MITGLLFAAVCLASVACHASMRVAALEDEIARLTLRLREATIRLEQAATLRDE